MSVRVENESYNESVYRFIGIVHNISNETMYLEGVTIQMFDSDNNLLDFTGTEQNENLHPNEKVLYRSYASTINNEVLDHYVISVRGNESPNGNIVASPNGSYPKELYDECVRVAGDSFCEFLFRK
jgi:hypothetical protein